MECSGNYSPQFSGCKEDPEGRGGGKHQGLPKYKKATSSLFPWFVMLSETCLSLSKHKPLLELMGLARPLLASPSQLVHLQGIDAQTRKDAVDVF